jgi:hypothetical protein
MPARHPLAAGASLESLEKKKGRLTPQSLFGLSVLTRSNAPAVIMGIGPSLRLGGS